MRQKMSAVVLVLACALSGVPLISCATSPRSLFSLNAGGPHSLQTGWSLNVPGFNFQLNLGPSQPLPADSLNRDFLGGDPLVSNDYDEDVPAPEQGVVAVQGEGDGGDSAAAVTGTHVVVRLGDLLGTISAFGNQLSRLVGMSARRPEGGGIVFHLFTRDNMDEPERLFSNDSASISNSHYDARKPTKVLIHGYNSKQGPNSGGEFLKDALLEVGDFNVITVDWSAVDPKIYPVDVASTVPEVGLAVAEMVRALVTTAGADLHDFHIIGHSLGAHIAGAAGSLTLGPEGAGRITGLDPAGPLFEGHDAANRLDPSDAGFVDAVHTDGGLLGIVQPVGHVDFYVEGGRHIQPACGVTDVIGFCSHCFAFEILEDAIRNPQEAVATACTSWESYKRGECENEAKEVLGDTTNPQSRGNYYLHTTLVPSLPLRMFGKPLSAVGELSRAFTGGQSLAPRC